MHKVNKIFGVGVFFLFFFPSVPWGKLRHPVTGGRYQLRHTVSQSFKPLKLAGLDYFLTSKNIEQGPPQSSVTQRVRPPLVTAEVSV